MDHSSLLQYLHDNIPITEALGVAIIEATPGEVILSAPLLNNINHKRTAFGGSLQSLATLACWTLMHINLRDSFSHAEIVITHSEIDYRSPISDDFFAVSQRPSEKIWQRFCRTLAKRGKSRISLEANVYQGPPFLNTSPNIAYTGTFAAIS